MKTELTNNFNAVLDYLKDLSSSELVSIHNTYCSEANYNDDEIYSNDEDFFNTFFDGRPYEVARSCFYGDYNYSHDYVVFNGYGNLESFNSPEDKIDFDGIANYILENPEAFDIELIEEEEESEEN